MLTADEWNDKKIIAWGVGNAFVNFIRNYDFCNVTYAVDDFRSGQVIEGVSVYAPDKIAAEDKERICVVIFSLSSDISQLIARKLTDIGLVRNRHFIDYAVLLEKRFAHALLQKGIALEVQWLDFVKSLFYQFPIKNHSSILGSWLVLGLLQQTKNIAGDAIELGVYEGGNAFCAALFLTLNNDKRKYILLDSFEGFGDFARNVPQEFKDRFRDVSFTKVNDIFSDLRTAEVVQGYVPNVLPSLQSSEYSFVYYDCDLYEPLIDALQYFYPRLTRGGYFLVDDYSVTDGFLDIRRGVDEFCGERCLDIIEIPETTHALIHKR